jgi:hypothetical protein
MIAERRRLTQGSDEKCIQNFSRITWDEETTWETCIDGRILLKRTLKMGWDGMELIHLVQDRAQWLVLVNMVKRNLHPAYKAENARLASQEKPHSMELLY